jgi:Family of unknown function (DUF6463)
LQGAAMRRRLHRRNLVVWSSSVVVAHRSEGPRSRRETRPTRARRIRWWLRVGALLMILGVLRLARTARTRWEPLSLGVGALLTVIGFVAPPVWGLYLLGLLVLSATLILGIREQRHKRDPAG